MRRSLAAVVFPLLSLGVLMTVSASAGADTKAEVRAKLLSLSNMPAGWSPQDSGAGSVTRTGCTRILSTSAKAVVRATAFYVDGTGPAVGEVLEYGKGAAARYREVDRVLSHCKGLGGTVGGVHISGTVNAMSFPNVASHSSAFSASITIKGFSVNADIVLFEVGRYAGEIFYEDVGQPDIGQVEGFVNEGVAKVERKPLIAPNNVGSAGGNFT